MMIMAAGLVRQHQKTETTDDNRSKKENRLPSSRKQSSQLDMYKMNAKISISEQKHKSEHTSKQRRAKANKKSEAESTSASPAATADDGLSSQAATTSKNESLHCKPAASAKKVASSSKASVRSRKSHKDDTITSVKHKRKFQRPKRLHLVVICCNNTNVH